MKLRFHPRVQKDINEVLGYYAEHSLTAGDRFWDDLQIRFHEISTDPGQFGFIHRQRGLRRVRLRKFPYLVIYYQTAAGVKVTCIKHAKRHPAFGLGRK